VARVKLQYFGHVTRGSAGNLALSLGGQCRWFTSPRKTQKTVDGRHRSGVAVATFSWRRCHKTGSSGEERQ